MYIIRVDEHGNARKKWSGATIVTNIIHPYTFTRSPLIKLSRSSALSLALVSVPSKNMSIGQR